VALARVDAYAQAPYPSKAVRLVLGFPPGTNVDVLARPIASRMTEMLGQPIVVDNRAGAGGAIGVQLTAKAAPDGYTILMAAPSLTVNATLMRPAPYDVVRDLTAVGQATTSQYVIVAHPAVPARSVKELIALARAQPGKLNYGSGGPGNSTHLAGEYFKSLARVDIVHVPYKGSGPAIVDLLGGQVQLMFANIVAVLPQVKSGRLRGLATSGAARYSATPDLPTVIEAGVPGYVVTSWFGILAPARTPQAVITKLNGVLVGAMREREMLDRIAAEGAEPAPSTPAEFGKHVASELAIWAKVIKAAGL
ncbi:MAG TPA: tripartite tricarboxylate transporter substrate binding protein, partial [Burkholderiales bacterium]|nr:tripartite tricarboxylate transporter substrate binding protein [Burkholderiales bacterium]